MGVIIGAIATLTAIIVAVFYIRRLKRQLDSVSKSQASIDYEEGGQQAKNSDRGSTKRAKLLQSRASTGKRRDEDEDDDYDGR